MSREGQFSTMGKRDDENLGIQSDGDKYHDQFLTKRPKKEWSPYIDETAKDLSSGIQISDLLLTKDNFGRELGAYYRRGLEKSAGRYADLPTVLEKKVSDKKLGLLAYQLNELSYDISKSNIEVDNVEKATEAVLEKLLTRHVGEDLSVSFDVSGSTVSDITTQLFNNKTIASNVDLLLTEIENSASQGLLSLLDEPQMMTPLWEHQREALRNWCNHNKRGYVDMATATGKTVLGLGAIALQYGELHPENQAIDGVVDPVDSTDSDDVLIVAHSELILEQWRREFEKHLNIPQERTTGSNNITLEWGTVHFRTPQSLINKNRVAYDLVLLDEAHHYATGSEWGSLLDELDGNMLAMSGSVDDAGSDSERIEERLSNSVGPKVKRYTVTEAREDGVIPSFDWEVHYAPYDIVGDSLEKSSERAEGSFQEFRERLQQDELSLETDRRLRTYEDIRQFSHTTEGNSLKQKDHAFRDLVTRLFSRRTEQWNLSPILDAVVDLIIEHHTTEKVVVLADSNAQVDELESRITDVVENPSSVYLVSGSQSKEEKLKTIEKFDKPESSDVLIGTGDLLGEGVDMQHASVAINMATGGVNQQLVQRIGRVLRSPEDTPKHAMFYNVVGVPPTEDAAIPREDGKQIIEQAAGFCSLGRRFSKLPGFALSGTIDDDVVATFLREGAQFIESLDVDGEYEWDREIINQADLTALHDAVQAADDDVETILGEWEEYAWEHSEDNPPITDETDADGPTETGDDKSQSKQSVVESESSDAETLPPVEKDETTPEQDDTDQEAEPSTETDNGGPEQTIFWAHDVDPITEYEEEQSVSDDTDAKENSLDKKIDEWKSQLLDLTRQNKLVSFEPTKTKDLPFEDTNPTTIADEIDGDGELFIRKRPTEDDGDDQPDIATNEVLPTRAPDEAANSLSQIALKNKQYLRERGVDSLYISLGMLRWYSVDYSDEANRSPLFLAPVELEEKTIQDEEKHDYVLKSKAEGLRLNPALRKKLAAERGISLPADNALSLAEIDAAFEAVYETLRGFDRWTIQPDAVLGISDFTKYSLYSDIERNREAIKDDSIIQALNGEMEPLQKAEGDITTPKASELDDVVSPIDTYQVLDADSSQQEAIEAAKRGKSFVLQGPPGTGKSQTIANIIAEKLAAGERVLFVSEKQAALNVVKNRLDDVGLGRFCLEVHGEKATNADVLGSLETELKAPHIKPADNRAKRLGKLCERRDTINQYGQQLFYSPDGWDLTAYQAFGIVSKHTDVPRIDVGITQSLSVGQETLETAIDELETLARFDEEIDTYETSPWRHTTLRQWGVDTGDSMRQSLERQVGAIETLQDVAVELESELGLRPDSLTEFREVKQLLQHVSNCPNIAWQDAFFDGSFAQEGGRLEELAELEQERESLIDELSDHYQRSFFSVNGAGLNNELAAYGMLKIIKPSYWSLKRKIMTHARDNYGPSHDQLLKDTRKLAEVQRIEDRREDFRGVIERLGPLYEGGDTDWETLIQAQRWVARLDEHDSRFTKPIVKSLVENKLPGVDPLLERTNTALADYDYAAAFFENAMNIEKIQVNDTPLRQASFPELSETLQELRGDVPALQRRIQFASQLDTVRDTVCEEYVERFLQGDYKSDHLVPAFKKRFYTKWLNSVYEQIGLGSFNADEMERYVEEFRRLDKEQQELAKVEIQHEVTNRRPSLDLEHASSAEQVLVRREAEKQRKHKPLRELFDEAGSFITQLTPCFMMSPLSVAQYLKADSIEFDTVVFDEASQIMPQDAVSSLIRADQVVIAGDTKQLPPTSFFQSDVETTEDVREDLDSILEETASVLPEKNLRWHYRSRTEELIQFSNYHYYNNSLRTFPENNADVETGVDFEYVEDGVYDRGGSRQNEVEAQRVVDLIEEHAEERSDKSLGVVAFSSAQEQAIRDTLAERREGSPVLDAFVSQDDVLDEFFIKSLEMVQGDERDRMIFSVGYGPAQDGTISTNFGPINKSGGERRLNVAVTRAKKHITVVCSMLPGDIDLSGSNSTGAKHFKNYLEYARKGEEVLVRDDEVTDTLDFDSQFEEAVYDALEAEGYDVVSQVQSSSYSIDLAIKDPEQPGKFILGIECDGAAYHSSKTARDRDRTRQMVLEDLGWTIHRIWSPDWASNQEREIRKINEKVEDLLDGQSFSTDDPDIPSHEPEAMEVDSKVEHDEITESEEPSVE
jgi:superfamily II DNA or RNA helicase/very-short-patch-repair endonuclease